MDYISIDLETTGLSLHSNILQIAAVYVTEGKEKSVFTTYVRNGKSVSGEPYALAMNQKALYAIAKGGEGVLQREEAVTAFEEWVTSLGVKKPIIAGKNASGFDIPILRNNGFKMDGFSHRVMDIGPLYAPEFGYIPSITEINKLLGRPAVTHDALEDARDVIAAIEAKVKK